MHTRAKLGTETPDMDGSKTSAKRCIFKFIRYEANASHNNSDKNTKSEIRDWSQ